MTTTKTLKLNFINSEEKKSALSIPDAALDLTKEEVQKAMNLIAQENVFNRNGVDLYQIPDRAQYVERNVTTVFDNSEQK